MTQIRVSNLAIARDEIEQCFLLLKYSNNNVGVWNRTCNAVATYFLPTFNLITQNCGLLSQVISSCQYSMCKAEMQ